MLVSVFSFSQNLQVGIVTDFEKSTVMDSIFRVMASEIDRTTGSARKVTLAEGNISYNTRSLQQAKINYEIVSQKSDIILLVGSISTKGSLQESFEKPTIGLGISDPELQEIPFKDGKSGVKNFSYIWSSHDFVKEIKAFKELNDFNNLAVLVDQGSAITFNEGNARAVIDSLSQTLSTNINIVVLNKNIEQSLAALPSGTDAVYLTVLYDMSINDIANVATELNSRNLPSFSGTKWHVDQGILGSISDDNGLDQVIRKLSIMVDGALGRGNLEDMPVAVNNKTEFHLNLQTAKEIGLSPPFKIIFTANLINESTTNLPTYSLEEIMNKALEANFDIKISYEDIDITEQDIIGAKSALLPALDLSVSGVQIDDKRANATFGSPERSLSGQLALNQIIYSEEAIAGVKISQYLKKAQEYDTEGDVLVVLQDTYIGYFNVLSAKTNLLIQEENLKNTKTNLELAKLRVDLGSASKADVLRWESEVATAKQGVVEANTGLITAKLQLNTFLANTLEREYDIEDITLDDDTFNEFRNGPLSQFVETPEDFALVSDFLVSEALTENPNKKFLLENINIVQREKLLNKRLFYAPNVALQAQTNQILGRGGKGSTEVPGVELVDNSWQVGIGLSYPIFQGNNRKANLARSNIQLEQLDYSLQKLDQNLELAVRSNTLNVLNTTTNIEFSRVASDNAAANYELVRDNYQQGLVTITQLIDAQQAALNAKLRYALSIYDYLQSQVQLEFATGFFSRFLTADELQEFQNRFSQFTSDN